MSATRYRVGVDIGGTFTDIVLAGPDGSLHTCKTLSTPDDYGRGIAQALKRALDDSSVDPSAVERIVHATTVATNAIVEAKGAPTALVTTEGFRDVLEMRRLRIPEMYTLNYRRSEPLVPRRLRLEVRERMGPRGEVRIPLDEQSVIRVADRLAAEAIEAVAITLLHSYANPAHERRVAEILRERLHGDIFITCSSEILPVIREYERTSTTVINAYLGPTLRRYFASLRAHLASIGVEAPLQVMKSDGGVMTVDAGAARPAYIVESGPAAGVIGAARLTRSGTTGDCITLDMGGTTAKAAIVERGEVARTGDYEVGAGINLSSKLVMGGGYALKLPVIDVSEIGSGGGSLVTLDAGGLVKVGPKSAGAVPGPVAYGAGGEQATFTDAVIALGYLNPDHLVGGGLALDAAKARAAIQAQIADPLGKDLLDAAFGIYQVACGTMVRAVKAVSTYRGRDPRDFALFAFGGNGPVVAAELARLLEMRRVIVPPHPGVFSACGLLKSNVAHEASRAFLHRLNEVAPDAMGKEYARLTDHLRRLMAEEGYAADAYALGYAADLRYAGQAHELAVPVQLEKGEPDFADMAAAFGAEHEKTYGHQAEAEAVECVTLRVWGQVPLEETAGTTPRRGRADAGHGGPRCRPAFFGPSHGVINTPVHARADLGADGRSGALIVEEYDSTCVVPPGWTARLDDAGNIVLTAQ